MQGVNQQLYVLCKAVPQPPKRQLATITPMNRAPILRNRKCTVERRWTAAIFRSRTHELSRWTWAAVDMSSVDSATSSRVEKTRTIMSFQAKTDSYAGTGIVANPREAVNFHVLGESPSMFPPISTKTARIRGSGITWDRSYASWIEDCGVNCSSMRPLERKEYVICHACVCGMRI